MTILDSCGELLEICRVKCGPSDEPILPGGRTNEQAMVDAIAAIEQSANLVRALDEADTAFAVLNICDGLTPQARGCIRSAWPLVQQELAKIKGRSRRSPMLSPPSANSRPVTSGGRPLPRT